MNRPLASLACAVPFEASTRSEVPLFAWRRLCLLLLVLMAALCGCATQSVTNVTLSGIARGQEKVAGPVPPELVRLARGGAVHPAEPEMVLENGDVLSTGPDTAVVVSYPSGARAYVHPNTRVRIGSLFLDIGKVFVRVKGLFEVKTTFLTAGSEGTEYWVQVDDARASVVVLEGRVRLTPAAAAAAWQTMTLGVRQQGLVTGGAAPALRTPDPTEVQRELEFVERMDRLVPVKTGLSRWVIPAAAVGIGVLIWNKNRQDDKRGSDGPPEGNPDESVRSRPSK